MDRLKGKTAFVTGGGAGIGRAFVHAFAAEGATVAVLDIKEDLAKEAAASAPKPGRAIPFVCDVSNRAAVFKAMGEFVGEVGGLDVLINNAVYFHYAPLPDMPEDVIHRMLDVGLKGVYWATQAATPHLIKRGGGAVINMSSVAVFFAIKNAGVYSSIKGAIDAFTRQQAVELGMHGIRVNALAPGAVSTPGANSIIDAAGWELRKNRSPLKRLASPEEIAAAAVYLASDDGRSIAGVTLKIDGAVTIAGT